MPIPSNWYLYLLSTGDSDPSQISAPFLETGDTAPLREQVFQVVSALFDGCYLSLQTTEYLGVAGIVGSVGEVLCPALPPHSQPPITANQSPPTGSQSATQTDGWQALSTGSERRRPAV